MIHWIVEADKSLFLIINGMHNHVLDFLMYWITNKFTWFPFYLLIIIWLIYRYKVKGLIAVLMIVVVIVMCDQFTSTFMKPFFARLRPCHDPEISALDHMVVSCGGLYGFCSSHAANSFGLAMFLFLLFRKKFPKTAYLFVWAALISYSRVYVGVHFPGDVLTGAFIGVAFAWIVYRIYSRLPEKVRLQPLRA